MDYIKNLMLQTGWSCDDLIKKIQECKIQLHEVNSNEDSKSTTIDNRTEVLSEKCSTSDSHHHVSIVEVQNDHSYTCRKSDIVSDYEVQKKMHKQDRRKFYENYIKTFIEKRKQKYSRKIYFPRKIKRKYLLLLKHSTINRKMLICKYKSQEVVRTEIMHQLELLRSKRTLGISSDITQTVISDPIFSKKRYSGDKIREGIFSEINGDFRKEACDTNNSSDDPFCDKLATLNRNEFSKSKLDPYSIKPTKTNDITKIKGWKNKKFITLKSTTSEKIASEVRNDDPFENSSVTVAKSDIKSAFASTHLDGFLHESANLHISFEIPTLDSGNNTQKVDIKKDKSQISKKVSTSPLVHKTEDKLLKIQKVDVLNLYRPRTLGQKRRIWKLKCDNRMKRKTEEVSKPRTLAEKRRLLDYDMDVKNKLKTDNVCAENNLKYSYVVHRGRKLKVPTRTGNHIVASIKSHYGKRDYIYIPKKVKSNKIKPSIFAKTPAIQSQVMKYRPGPLSKKVTLQELNKDWKAEIKQLPKIYLEVRPRSCKPIWPKVRHLLPQYGFELTDERISFALTALKSNDNMQSFTFPLSYSNKQESLLLRRRVQTVEEPLRSTEDNKIVEEVVENVISKMLDYVETKNISDEVVRDDVTDKMMREENTIINDKQNNLSKRRKTKQSKTNYELKRLNVKVIEVNLEDKGESDNCKKDFCRLGCVCKSLSTTSSLVSNHCGVPDCMFECKCNYEKKNKGNLKVTLPIGTDLLSEGAVNRLEVEAKKNLAKVEKEFTQTVIQANNQTIVVGGCTNRQRRVTKLPKKYTDYIEDPDGVGDTTEVITNSTNTNVHLDEKFKNWKAVPCTVHLINFNLEQVVPYCMVHRLHDCHCKYSALYDIDKDEIKPEEILIKPDRNILNDKLPKGGHSGDIEIINSCARTKGLPTNYYLVRNKTEKFIASRRRKLDKIYRDYMDKEIRLKVNQETEDVNVYVADEVPKADDESNISKNIQGIQKKTRRKQNLLIRRGGSPVIQKKLISISENAIQRRKNAKKYIRHHLESAVTLSTSPEKLEEDINKPTDPLSEKQPQLVAEKNLDCEERVAKFNQIFQIVNSGVSSSNTFIPSLTIQEKLNEILGKNVGSHTQFRFIPWDILVKKYEGGSLQLWYSTFFKKPRIIATDNKTIPKHFINVRSYENIANKEVIKADLIRWLVSKKFPESNCKENIFVIVQLTKTHCELSGLWEKKQNSKTDKMMLISQTTDRPTIDSKKYSIVKKIMFSRCKFSKQTLIEAICTPEELKKIPAMIAYLPQISNNTKWRMIKLNSDFSVLSLHRNKYAIKYSDLQKVMKMAKETSYTIVLKTPEVETNYPHPDYGMYASPDCDDIIFIGPYYNNEGHDIVTLRYANGELIRTDLYCKMNGQKPASSGIWLYQIILTKLNQDNVQTIDLTECESDHELKVKEESNQETSPNRSLLKPKVDEGNPIKKKKKRDHLISCSDLLVYESCATNYHVPTDFYKYIPEEVNVNSYMQDPVIYFLPNIPKMGFIVGHNLHNSVVVRWPSLRSAIKFPDITNAVKYLERELNIYFIRKPPEQICVHVLPEIDTSKKEMFDSEILLKGYYIACYMGIIPLLDITKSTLKHLRMTLSEVEVLAKERAQRMIFDKCYELAKKLFSPVTLEQPTCSDAIIQMIIDEIKRQEILEHELLVHQSKLIEKKQALRIKCSDVIKRLAPLVSSKMQNAMKKILDFNKSIAEEKQASSINDVICIDMDSDEDVPKYIIEKPSIDTSTTLSPIPKITVKKLQDLKEPSTSTNSTSNSVTVNSVSILKNKSPNNDHNVSVSSEVKKSAGPLRSTIVRSSDISSPDNKSDTIKRTLLNKKCSKFVIKTSTGKYMTIRAENLKQLPVKKLQPIAPNDPVISKLNTMNTKRIIMPKNHNGFVKVNFNEKSSRLNEIISKSVPENVQSSTEN